MSSKLVLRKAVFFVHLWLGLLLGLYLSVVGVTGSFLVFTDNLEPMIMPELAHCQPAQPGAQLLPLSEVLARVRSEGLGANDEELGRMLMPARQGGAYRLVLDVRHPEKRRSVSIDPYDGHVIRDQLYKTTFFGFVRELHVELLLGLPGALANGVGGILASLLVLSGLWLWWPATLHQFRRVISIKWGAGARRLWLDMHRLVGFCTFLGLLAVTVTGALFVFPRPVELVISALHLPLGSRKSPKVAVLVGTKRLTVDQLVAIAETVEPEIAISSINYPVKPDQPFSCFKRSFRPGFLPYINIFIDPYSGKILKVMDDRTAPSGAKFNRILHYIHFGLWGGVPVKSLYVLVGLAPLWLFVTGVLMYFGKRRRGERKQVMP